MKKYKKQLWKAGNMLYPLPAVMVSVTDGDGRDNIITVAWTGTICTNPPMVYISVRPSRFSCDMIRKTGEFVINLTTEETAFATDYCGVRSGRDTDKIAQLGLTLEEPEVISVPGIRQLPLTLECKVRYVQEQDLSRLEEPFLSRYYPQDVDGTYPGSNRDYHLAFYGEIVDAYIIE
jgi:flavin reductase (DIM6/NTAB) family NADH-FMN oxidoreductase RutF